MKFVFVTWWFWKCVSAFTCTETGVAFDESDSSKFSIEKNWEDCQRECADALGCRGWSYLSKNCFLFDKLPGSTDKDVDGVVGTLPCNRGFDRLACAVEGPNSFAAGTTYKFPLPPGNQASLLFYPAKGITNVTIREDNTIRFSKKVENDLLTFQLKLSIRPWSVELTCMSEVGCLFTRLDACATVPCENSDGCSVVSLGLEGFHFEGHSIEANTEPGSKCNIVNTKLAPKAELVIRFKADIKNFLGVAVSTLLQPQPNSVQVVFRNRSTIFESQVLDKTVGGQQTEWMFSELIGEHWLSVKCLAALSICPVNIAYCVSNVKKEPAKYLNLQPTTMPWTRYFVTTSDAWNSNSTRVSNAGDREADISSDLQAMTDTDAQTSYNGFDSSVGNSPWASNEVYWHRSSLNSRGIKMSFDTQDFNEDFVFTEDSVVRSSVTFVDDTGGGTTLSAAEETESMRKLLNTLSERSSDLTISPVRSKPSNEFEKNSRYHLSKFHKSTTNLSKVFQPAEPCVTAAAEYSGLHLKSVEDVPRYADCLVLCHGNSDCKSWVWHIDKLACDLQSDVDSITMNRDLSITGRMNSPQCRGPRLNLATRPPTQCTEVNVDYSGGDLSQDFVNSSAVCSQLCGKTTGCEVWTFVIPHESTPSCYLKGNLAMIVPVENVADCVSGVNPNSYPCRNNFEDACVFPARYLSGVVLAEINGIKRYSECLARCSETKHCVSWSYSTITELCRLSSSNGSAIQDAGYVSGFSGCELVADPSISDDVCLEHQVDFDGGQHRTIWNISSPQACREACLADAMCDFWTMAEYYFGDSACYLKTRNHVNRVSRVADVVSGSRICDESTNLGRPLPSCISFGQKYSGAVLGTFPNVKSYVACLQHCLDDQRCRSWAFSNLQQTCTLQDTFTESSPGDFSSGIVDARCVPSVTKFESITTCVLHSVDLYGGDVSTSNAWESDGYATCAHACESELTCKAWTFTPVSKRSTGTCYLKPKVDDVLVVYPVEGVISGLAECGSRSPEGPLVAGGNGCVSRDTVYQGAVIRTISGVATYSYCLSQCKQLGSCNFWSYAYANRECLLLGGSGAEIVKNVAGYVSGKLDESCSLSVEAYKANDQRQCVEKNVDYDGRNWQFNASIRSVEGCRDICRLEPACLLWSFVSDVGCYLKSTTCGINAVAQLPGVTSGSSSCADALSDAHVNTLSTSENAQTGGSALFGASTLPSAEQINGLAHCIVLETAFGGATLETVVGVDYYADCIRRCHWLGDCAFWTYSTSARTCTLLSEIDSVVSGVQNSVSGRVVAECANVFTTPLTNFEHGCVVKNVDFNGGDEMADWMQLSWQECQEGCTRNAGCQYWTATQKSNGTVRCLMKGHACQIDVVAPVAGVVSGKRLDDDSCKDPTEISKPPNLLSLSSTRFFTATPTASQHTTKPSKMLPIRPHTPSAPLQPPPLMGPGKVEASVVAGVKLERPQDFLFRS